MVNQNDFDPSLLLYWLTHRGEVSRRTLRSAIDGILPEETEDNIKTNTIRRRLIELGHAVTGDGVNGYDRLKILPPYLVSLSDRSPDKAEVLLCGGRTPTFLSEIRSAGASYTINTLRESQENAPERITLCGNIQDLRAVATAIAVPLIEQATERHIMQASKLWAQQLEVAPIEKEPRSQDCEHWDWSTKRWESGLPPKSKEGSILYVTTGFGIRSCLIYHHKKWKRVLSKSEAQYFSAAIIKEPIIRYDAEKKTLASSLRPPPELSRPLCLCTGFSYQRVHGKYPYEYENISEDTASRWVQAFDLSMTVTLKTVF
jgi:hypothetical protein